MFCPACGANIPEGSAFCTVCGITVFLLGLVTCGIYTYVWLYKAGEKVNVIKRLNGEAPDTNAPIIYLVLAIFGLGIISYYLIQEQLNKVAAY